MHNTRRLLGACVVLGGILAVVAGGGCASGGGGAGGAAQDPVAQALARDEHVDTRKAAIDQIWAQVESGTMDRMAGREAIKRVVWGANPEQVRLHALRTLAGDETEVGLADTESLMGFLLPTEGNLRVLAFIGETVASRGWVDVTPALIRSYARPTAMVDDADRAERGAIERLHSGKSVEEVAFEVFLYRPGSAGEQGLALDRAEKARLAAWDLLGRLDPEGSARVKLMSGGVGSGSADPTLDVLRAAAGLGVVPVTSSELEWVRGVFASQAAEDRAWWAQVTSAVEKLGEEQRVGLRVRHLEPVRWAAAHQPDLLVMGRAELLSDLKGRLSGRKVYRREREGQGFGMGEPETIEHWESRLSWGDMLAIRVIDQAMEHPAVANALFAQAEEDRRDTSTEHGGVLSMVATGAGEESAVYPFPPRASQRFGDRRFVASDDMFRSSGRSLAHYHFHVQEARNRAYAGPGEGDMEYARAHGRNCLVLTSVQDDVMNVDYYQSNGAVVDLGELRR